MAEYIDKQAFNDAIREAVRKYPNTFYNGLEVARQIAHDMDAADVVPVRHGRWEEVRVDEDDDGVPTLIVYACDNCRIVSWTATPFCGYCGAKMEGEA